MKILKLLFCFNVSIFFFSCDQDQNVSPTFESKPVASYDHEVITAWNDVLLKIEKNAEGYRPGPATRTLAYLGLSAYESVVYGMPEYNSFNGYWPGFDMPKFNTNLEYCWPLAINASFEYLLPKFFGKASEADLDLIITTAQNFNERYKETVSIEVYNNSQAWGKQVAESVWNYSKTDPIGHNHYLNPTQSYDWHKLM